MLSRIFFLEVFLTLLFINAFASNNISISKYNITVSDTIWMQDTVWVYDTIWVYDTVWVYDTIYIDKYSHLKNIEPIDIDLIEKCKSSSELLSELERLELIRYQQKSKIKKKKPNINSSLLKELELEIYGGPAFQNTKYNKCSLKDGNRSLQNNIKDLIGFKYGLRFNYQLKKFSFKTGVDMHQSSEEVSLYATPDSIYSALNEHFFIEIPVIGAYHFNYLKTNLNFQLGLVNQVHLHSNSNKRKFSKTINEIDYTKYNSSLYTALGGAFNINKRLLLGLEAYYQYPLNKFVTINDLSIDKQFYGFNLIFNYKLSIDK